MSIDLWDAPVGGLVPASQVAVVSGLNGPVGVVPSGLLQSPLVAVAEGSPGLPLVVDGGRVVSAGEVLGAGRRVGRRLVDAGVGRDRLVGVVMDKGWEQVVATVAVLEAGGAYLPLSAEWPAQRLAQLLALGEVEVVLTQSWVAASVEWPVGVSVVVVDEEVLVGGVPEPLGVEVSADDLAYVIFTSGSTGVPKGVMVEHRSALNTVVDVNTRFGVGAGDVVLALSSLSFDLSVYDVFGLGAVGGRVVFPGREALRDPAAWARLVADEGVTVWNTVPALAELLVEHAEPRGLCFDGLRLVLLSGDWIPVGLPERLRRVAPNARIVSLGGATEAAIWSIVHPVDAVDPAWPSIPYGKPLTNQTMHVLDERLELCPTWVPGELFIGGVGVARGYWRDVERSEAAFIVHPVSGERLYRTGDLGRRHPDGTIEFLGRRDDQVKIRGYRIELGEIEAALAAHPEVRDTVVLARADNGTDKRLVAYLTTTNPDIDTSDLRRHLTSRLPTYMVPTAYVILDTFPLTANAKIDRANLPAPDTGGVGDGAGLGHTALTRRLAEILNTVIELGDIEADDDLFDAGIDSLAAIRTANLLEQAFGCYPRLEDFFDDPTLSGLAAFYEARLDPGSIEALVAAPLSAGIVPDVVGRFEPFPLKDIQQAYLLGRSAGFALGGVGVHVYTEVDARGLDVGRLERAAWRLVERHDMLRTVVLDDGRQQVLESVAGPLVEVVDLRGVDAGVVAQRLGAARDGWSHEVLAADRAPMFRVVAHLLDGGVTRVHVGVDMLILDATSLLMLMAEFGRFYEDPDLVLAPLEITFRDYVLAELALEESDAVRGAQEYWERRLESLPAAPQLALAAEPASVGVPRFVRRRAELDAQRWGRLKDRIAGLGLTPSMALCAAYAEVLAVWSRSPRFCLNVTLFNRLALHPQVFDLAGDFTSLELLEVDCGSPVAFVERARQLQRQLWEDLDHRQGSGVRLLRDLARARGAGAAGMPVVFTSLLGGSFDMSWLGEQVYGVSQTPQVWLDHQVMEVAGALVTTWDAVEELFPVGMLDDVFDAYVGLLGRLADDPGVWDAPVGGLVPASQVAVVSGLNGPVGVVPSGLLQSPLVAVAEGSPGLPLVVDGGRVVSAGEVLGAGRRVGRRLVDAGVGRDRLVGVVMDKGWEQVVATVAVLEAGGAYLPLSAEWPAQRLAQLLALGEVEVVLTQSWVAASVEWPVGVSVVVVDEEVLVGGVPEPLGVEVSADDLAYVIFTSGSTGVPKGVMVEHRSALNTVVDVNTRFGVGAGDVVLALSSLSFDLSVYDVFGLGAVGGRVVFPGREALRDPAAWARLVADEGVTVWNTVPALAELLVEHAEPRGLSFDGLRLVLLSGDWIPVGLPERLRRVAPNARIVSLGGATEAAIWSIVHPVDAVDPAWPSIPYGKPLTNQTMHVLDERLELCPTWVPGELFIGGVGVARGYWRDVERSEAAFIVHPVSGERLYRTGDLGRRHPDGTIEFLGRRDDQVKIRGYRIELGEIEAALAAHPEVRDTVVLARADNGTDKRLVAYLTTTNPDIDTSDLRRHLTSRLPTYMVPTAYVILDTFPLTANAKIDRANLPAPDTGGVGDGAGLGHTALTRRLAEILNTVIELGDIEPDDDLFDAGIDSLAAIRTANLLEQEYGYRPEPSLIFFVTLRQLGELLEGELGAIDVDGRAARTAAAEPPPPASPSEPSSEPASAPFSMMIDPEARAAFKAARPGLLDVRDLPSAALPQVEPPPALYERASATAFAPEPVALVELARVLSSMRARLDGDHRKLAYPSAGGTYPVQTYVHVKPGRVVGIDPGLHYYHPDEHRLYAVDRELAIDRRCHVPFNREAFEQSAFCIFLVAQLQAIEPLYGYLSERFCLLEAGAMLQTLMHAARPAVGLTPIGSLLVDPLQRAGVLGDGQQLLHTVLGGRAAVASAEDDLEEIEL